MSDLPGWLERFIKVYIERGSLELLLRFAFVMSCVGLCAVIWNLSHIPLREKKAAVAAALVHFMLAAGIEFFVLHRGVYRYLIDRQMLWGIPFDIHFGWAALWGAGLCIGWRTVQGRWKIVVVIAAIAAAQTLDFAALASGRAFIPLTPWWWLWDLGALIILASSTLYFYTLILENRALYFRAAVYGILYAFIFYLLLPALILKLSQSTADATVILNPWSLIALSVCSIPGLIAAAQFALNGDGSPLPLDPTRKLVVTGIYAHVRNPMQLSGVAAALVWAIAGKSWFLWIYALDLAILLQLTLLFEERELRARFGDEFERYRSRVRLWWPRISK